MCHHEKCSLNEYTFNLAEGQVQKQDYQGRDYNIRPRFIPSEPEMMKPSSLNLSSQESIWQTINKKCGHLIFEKGNEIEMYFENLP